MSRGANVRIQMICYQKRCKQTVEWHLANNERGKKICPTIILYSVNLKVWIYTKGRRAPEMVTTWVDV